MKTLSVFLCCCSIFFISCDEDFGLFDTSVTLTKTFTVDVPADGANSFSMERAFDAATDPTVEDIIDEIENYTVDEIGYKITGFTGDQTHLSEATFTITNADGTEIASTTITNVDIGALNGAEEQVLDFTQDDIDLVEAALKESNAVNVVLSATIDNKPVAFDLELLMDITIEYRVFN